MLGGRSFTQLAVQVGSGCVPGHGERSERARDRPAVGLDVGLPSLTPVDLGLSDWHPCSLLVSVMRATAEVQGEHDDGIWRKIVRVQQSVPNIRRLAQNGSDLSLAEVSAWAAVFSQ